MQLHTAFLSLAASGSEGRRRLKTMGNGKKRVVGSLITVGDEILFGNILNTNAQYITAELRDRGFILKQMISVGDCEQDIVEKLLECNQKSDFVIVTGGLGPTDDDRTNAAVSQAFKRPLVPHREYVQWLKDRLTKLGRQWNDYLEKMASLPEGAVKIGLGMAGYYLEHESVPCYFLPGVPDEMRYLMAEFVIPSLEIHFPDRPVYSKRILRVVGFFESELNRILEVIRPERGSLEIGYLPHDGEIRVTILGIGSSQDEVNKKIDDMEEKILALIGPGHLIGRDDDSLEKVIGRELRDRNWKMAVAESCTGGLLSNRIVSVPGASDYFDRGLVVYSNRSKVDLLHVPPELIEAHGAVSEQVGLAMAQGVRNIAGVQVGVSVTGIAGPGGGSPGKPVGTVVLSCVTPSVTLVETFSFSGNREKIQQRASQMALIILWRALTDDSKFHSH